jgi:hypothetical protein
MCNYNTTGASLTPYLFSGVDGLSIFTNYNNGYGSYGNYGYGSCSNTSSGVWGAIGLALGSVAASIGIGIAGKAINNHFAKKTSNENQRKQIDNLRKTVEENTAKLNDQLSILGLSAGSSRSDIENFDTYDKSGRKAAEEDAAGKKTALESAERTLSEKQASYDNAKSILDAMPANDPGRSEQQALVNKLETELKELQTAKEKAEKDKQAADKKVDEAKEKERKMEAAKREALRLLDQIEKDKAKIEAYDEQYGEQNLKNDIDDADGNWFTRMGKRNFEVGEDGTITGDAKDITDRDIRKLGYRFRTGTNEERAKIKAYIEKNEDELRGKVKSGSDEETILNSILNS